VIFKPSLRPLLIALIVWMLGACASLQVSDPVRVTVAGLEALPGQGLELRMLVKLRIQNPNDAPIDYDGISLQLDVMERPFATGVSAARGSVPRFGEAIIDVPVTVSVLSMARQAFGIIDGKPGQKIVYVLNGKLNGPAFRSLRFESQGELGLPGAATSAPAP
jgi:LEA14-like dessication related protein